MSIPDDYFLDTDDEMLEYLENQSKESIKEIQKSNESNREKAYRLLNYLIGGIGALTLLLFNNLDKMSGYLIIGSITLITGWGISAFILSHHVILSQKRPLITNTPQNLYNETFKESADKQKLGILKRYELHNTNQNIIDLIALNDKYRRYTDKAIMISFSVPIATVLIFGISA